MDLALEIRAMEEELRAVRVRRAWNILRGTEGRVYKVRVNIEVI